ncbi:glycosyltransferase, partial [Yersinia pestis PY-102]
MGAGMFFL